MNKIVMIFGLLALFKYTYGNQDEDEKRPYEFGFSIEGEQHRYEKKDINGIIQGEFGFITADGVYHVTVYATDEKGNFRILKMKNIRISEPLDKSGRTSQSSTARTTKLPTATESHRFSLSSIPTVSTIAMGCSGCGIVTKRPPTPQQLNQIPTERQATGLSFVTPQPLHGYKVGQNGNVTMLDSFIIPKQNKLHEFVSHQDPVNEPLFTKKHVALLGKEGNAPPIEVTNNFIRVPGNEAIPIQDRFSNMAEGLPQGIKEQDVSDLLYRFNYTVGFHGHHEQGFRNGAKIGGYFFNGRDGYSRVVTYVADDRGYRSRFRLVYLGLDSPDVPKPDSEKKFGLQSFEFLWYPIK